MPVNFPLIQTELQRRADLVDSSTSVNDILQLLDQINSSTDGKKFEYDSDSLLPLGDSAYEGMILLSNGAFKVYNAVYDNWDTLDSSSVPEPISGPLWYGSRGLTIGGDAAVAIGQSVDYYDIATPANAADWGDTNVNAKQYIASCAANGTALHTAGTSTENSISYLTIASLGTAGDFGDMIRTFAFGSGGLSDDTYGIIPSGNNANAELAYVTIATPGNAADFGDLTTGRIWLGAANDNTRGLHAGGNIGTDTNSAFNIIDYITIATPGNATDFGDMSVDCSAMCGTSDTTRAVFTTGWIEGVSSSNNLEYVTIQTTGNSTDFGDLTTAQTARSATTNGTYGVVAGGALNRTDMNYFTIQTTGNATDFGDLQQQRQYATSTSGAAA